MSIEIGIGLPVEGWMRLIAGPEKSIADLVVSSLIPISYARRQAGARSEPGGWAILVPRLL